MKNLPLLLNFIATLPCKTDTSVNVNRCQGNKGQLWYNLTNIIQLPDP